MYLEKTAAAAENNNNFFFFEFHADINICSNPNVQFDFDFDFLEKNQFNFRRFFFGYENIML